MVGPEGSAADRLLAAARQAVLRGESGAACDVIEAVLAMGNAAGVASLLLDLDEQSPSGHVWRLMARSGDRRAIRALAGHVGDDGSDDDALVVDIGELAYAVPRPLAAAYELARIGSPIGANALHQRLRTGTDEERLVASHGLAALLPDGCRPSLEHAVTSDELIEVRVFAAFGLARLGDPRWIARAIPIGASECHRQLYWGDPLVVAGQVEEIGPLAPAAMDGIERVLDGGELDGWWKYVLAEAVGARRSRSEQGEGR